ncbi:MAG: nicotinate-nucleotide adenylyltransferase [Oxalobacteraceae bacterium]|nr:nicotinate-nucleotide adenylyltransferase [Oxalobacteraceae bacterium]
MNKPCILLLGGSFDPIHAGHIGVAQYFCTLLHPDELRLIPAGQPWQKTSMNTPAEHRIAMLKLAFNQWPVPVQIDTQEIQRAGPSYTVDTLHELRRSLGNDVSLAWIIGADQLTNFHTWHEWRQVFELTNLCIAARPGYVLDKAALNSDVLQEISRRLASPSQLRQTASGLSYIANNLAWDVSSTVVRESLKLGQPVRDLLPSPVLDYAQHHHLYQTT